MAPEPTLACRMNGMISIRPSWTKAMVTLAGWHLDFVLEGHRLLPSVLLQTLSLCFLSGSPSPRSFV